MYKTLSNYLLPTIKTVKHCQEGTVVTFFLPWHLARPSRTWYGIKDPLISTMKFLSLIEKPRTLQTDFWSRGSVSIYNQGFALSLTQKYAPIFCDSFRKFFSTVLDLCLVRSSTYQSSSSKDTHPLALCTFTKKLFVSTVSGYQYCGDKLKTTMNLL